MAKDQQKFNTKRVREMSKALRDFRDSREEFIELCTEQVWREWATTPNFYIQYGIANWPADLAADIAVYVLSQDRRHRWYDVADTIRAIYEDPTRWVVNTEYTFKSMLTKYGAPA